METQLTQFAFQSIPFIIVLVYITQAEYRARNNGQSTDSVRTDFEVDRSTFCLAGHSDRSYLIVLKMK